MSVLDESPRWLLSKGHLKKAYKIVFEKELVCTLTKRNKNAITDIEDELVTPVDTVENSSNKIIVLLKHGFQELTSLYGPTKLRRRLLICHFTWFVSALTYYVIGIYENVYNIFGIFGNANIIYSPFFSYIYSFKWW